jgi:hypothetical protein
VGGVDERPRRGWFAFLRKAAKAQRKAMMWPFSGVHNDLGNLVLMSVSPFLSPALRYTACGINAPARKVFCKL